jgi:hypothetical protein
MGVFHHSLSPKLLANFVNVGADGNDAHCCTRIIGLSVRGLEYGRSQVKNEPASRIEAPRAVSRIDKGNGFLGACTGQNSHSPASHVERINGKTEIAVGVGGPGIAMGASEQGKQAEACRKAGGFSFHLYFLAFRIGHGVGESSTNDEKPRSCGGMP